MDYSIIPVEMYDCVIANMRAGNKIQAIKEVRMDTGCGLKEAKDAVEALWENQHNLSSEPAIIAKVRRYRHTSFDEDRELITAIMSDEKTRNYILNFDANAQNRKDLRRAVGRAIADDQWFDSEDVAAILKAYDRANVRNDPEKVRRLAELKREIEALEAELED